MSIIASNVSSLYGITNDSQLPPPYPIHTRPLDGKENFLAQRPWEPSYSITTMASSILHHYSYDFTAIPSQVKVYLRKLGYEIKRLWVDRTRFPDTPDNRAQLARFFPATMLVEDRSAEFNYYQNMLIHLVTDNLEGRHNLFPVECYYIRHGSSSTEQGEEIIRRKHAQLVDALERFNAQLICLQGYLALRPSPQTTAATVAAAAAMAIAAPAAAATTTSTINSSTNTTTPIVTPAPTPPAVATTAATVAAAAAMATAAPAAAATTTSTTNSSTNTTTPIVTPAPTPPAVTTTAAAVSELARSMQALSLSSSSSTTATPSAAAASSSSPATSPATPQVNNKKAEKRVDRAADSITSKVAEQAIAQGTITQAASAFSENEVAGKKLNRRERRAIQLQQKQSSTTTTDTTKSTDVKDATKMEKADRAAVRAACSNYNEKNVPFCDLRGIQLQSPNPVWAQVIAAEYRNTLEVRCPATRLTHAAARILAQLPHLRRLDISFCSRDGDTAFDELQQIPQVTQITAHRPAEESIMHFVPFNMQQDMMNYVGRLMPSERFGAHYVYPSLTEMQVRSILALRNIERIDFGVVNDLGDAAFSGLNQLTRLSGLIIHSSKITDRFITFIEQLQLQCLNVMDCSNLTDEAITRITTCFQATLIDFYIGGNNHITDQSLNKLTLLRNLTCLSVGRLGACTRIGYLAIANCSTLSFLNMKMPALLQGGDLMRFSALRQVRLFRMQWSSAIPMAEIRQLQSSLPQTYIDAAILAMDTTTMEQLQKDALANHLPISALLTDSKNAALYEVVRVPLIADSPVATAATAGSTTAPQSTREADQCSAHDA